MDMRTYKKELRDPATGKVKRYIIKYNEEMSDGLRDWFLANDAEVVFSKVNVTGSETIRAGYGAGDFFLVRRPNDYTIEISAK